MTLSRRFLSLPRALVHSRHRRTRDPVIVECPHCYQRVLPRDGGLCPSCGKNVHDTRGANLKVTSLRIDEGMSLPPFFCSCGCTTERLVTIKRTRRFGDNVFFRILLWISYVLLWIFFRAVAIAIARGDSRHRKRTILSVRLHLPMCQTCSAWNKVTPVTVDFDNHRMTFIVDRSFADRIRG